MKKNNSNDLVKDMTVGTPWKQIIKFFLPLFLGNIFQQLYGVVDTIIVGKGINDKALAAVGATGAIQFFIFGFIVGITGGLSIPMANAFGAKDYKKLRKVIAMAIGIVTVLTIILYIISLLYARELLIKMQTPMDIFDDTLSYLKITLWGMGIIVFYNFTAFLLRALGDSRTPLVAMIIASFINIVLDIVFVVVIKMGVDGAAYATLIAQVFSLVFCFIRLRRIDIIRLQHDDWKIDLPIIKSLLKTGLPVGFMNSVTAIGVMILQYFVNGMGTAYTATYSASMRIIGLFEEPAAAIGLAVSTFSGQNYGAKKYERIKQGVKSSLFITFVINIILGLPLMIFPKQLISIMLSDPYNIELARQILPVAGAFLWSFGFLFVVRSASQGMGFTLVPMTSGILELFTRVFAILILGNSLGLLGVAIAEVSAWTAAQVMLMIYFFYVYNKI